MRHALPALMICGTVLGVAARSDPRSVWDGVYLVAQARQGEQLAAAQCVSCHGDGLTGGESAPPLAGDVFNANWDGVKLLDLLDRVRVTMPADKPGSLSRQQAADVVAYMLSLGKFPPGQRTFDAGLASQVMFESLRPER